MVLGKEHLRIATQGGDSDVVLAGQRNEVPEGFRILQDRFDAVMCHFDVDIKMCDTVLYTKVDELLSGPLC